MNSVWSETAKKPAFELQRGDLKTQVLIIGAGLCGILTAYYLRARGVDCIVCEADEVCSGATRNTTAKVTVAHGLIYESTLCRFGRRIAQGYLRAQEEALEEYRRLARLYPCDFEEVDSFVYSKSDRAAIEAEADAIRALGGRAEFTYETRLPFRIVGAVRMEGQGQMHPLKLAYALAKGLPILEHTRVTELLPNGVKTTRGRIFAKKVIVATHFPFPCKRGLYFLKLYQHRSYVLGLENAPNLGGIYVDAALGGESFRNYDGMLLIGTGGHRTGKRGSGWQRAEELAREYYPNARPTYRFSTQDCITLDGLPYIGQYSKSTPNLLVATGFNKWGMTNSMVAARLLSALACEKRSPYEEVFEPSRRILRPQLAVNAVESLIGLVTPTVPRCPHLGCALKYNRLEHSWDCPCHGSRFDEDGHLLDNPATHGKQDLHG